MSNLADCLRAAEDYSFLLESVTGSTETIGRYSYIGVGKFTIPLIQDGS